MAQGGWLVWSGSVVLGVSAIAKAWSVWKAVRRPIPPSWKRSMTSPLAEPIRIDVSALPPPREEELTPRRNGNDFVYVRVDGTVRDLTAAECEYIEKRFLLFDGGRPYIKATYDNLTPDGWINGFLPRSELPAHLRD